jgi:predicted Zn-dependent protease
MSAAQSLQERKCLVDGHKGYRDIIPQVLLRAWLIMNKVAHRTLGAFLILLLCAGSARAQTVQKGLDSDAVWAEKGIASAEQGRCSEALPLLKKATPRVVDKQLKYHAAMATARCAMSLEQTESAVGALLLLRKEFPHDPEVLYITTHFYSELANRASRELASTAPDSVQAQELDAEAFESQEKWDEAAAEYHKILDQDSQKDGIHYRLGRIDLAKTGNPAAASDAQKEFEAELKIDPSSASAEFMLGEIARQAGQWDQAAEHFYRAAKCDDGFSEAFLALGLSFNSAGKFPDAVAPLQRYIKMQPSDPAGHYQLAIAYARTGNKDGADREMAVQRAVSAKTPSASQPAAATVPH